MNTKISRFNEFNYHIFHINFIKRIEIIIRKIKEEFQYEFDNTQMIIKNINKIEYLNFDMNNKNK